MGNRRRHIAVAPALPGTATVAIVRNHGAIRAADEDPVTAGTRLRSIMATTYALGLSARPVSILNTSMVRRVVT